MPPGKPTTKLPFKIHHSLLQYRLGPFKTHCFLHAIGPRTLEWYKLLDYPEQFVFETHYGACRLSRKKWGDEISGFASAMTEGWGPVGGHHTKLPSAAGGSVGSLVFTVTFHWWFRLLRWACGVCVLGGGREHE